MHIAAILKLAKSRLGEHSAKEKNADLMHFEISAEQMVNAIRIANYYIEHAKPAFRKTGFLFLSLFQFCPAKPESSLPEKAEADGYENLPYIIQAQICNAERESRFRTECVQDQNDVTDEEQQRPRRKNARKCGG